MLKAVASNPPRLLHRFACTRGVPRQVTFRSLTGEAVELTLPPQHTLFHAKQALLDNVAKKMPALDVGYRRDARFFAGSEYLVETMLVAMLPDEVSVVFDQVTIYGIPELSFDDGLDVL